MDYCMSMAVWAFTSEGPIKKIQIVDEIYNESKSTAEIF